MPDPTIEELQRERDTLKGQLENVQGENNQLQNLLFSMSTSTKEEDDDGTKEGGSEKKEKPSNDGKVAVDPKQLAEAVTKGAKQIVDQTLNERDAAALQQHHMKEAARLNQKDPTFTLYIQEMMAVAQQHPTLTVEQCFKMAKELNPGKKPLPETVSIKDPREASDSSPEGKSDKTSPKIKTEGERLDRFGASFQDAAEKAWGASMTENRKE